MVKVNVGGFPTINLDTSAPDGVRQARNDLRRRMRGGNSGRQISLNWNTKVPRLVITSDTDDFDPTTVQHFQQEGFQLAYLAYQGNKSQYMSRLQHLQDPLELGEKYAIVAYGDAATLVLEACMKPMPKLVAVVAYYPPYMPRTTTNFPPTLDVQIHLTGSQKFGTRHPNYRYPDVKPGFAEHDMEEFDTVAAGLAWSRDIAMLRRAFDMPEYDLEGLWDDKVTALFRDQDADKAMDLMVRDEPYVNHGPTMTGGRGQDELRRFYSDFFVDSNPPDFKVKLLSRTQGADRVVDEMLVKFTHTVEMPWMLPGVPPTEKRVEVVLISVVSVRGGRLYQEHIHWDQASVLVQVGLLDPKLIPDSFKTAEEGREKEVKRLPVHGREAGRKIADGERYDSNRLISGW
ncbi:hypothetical protein B0A52_03741 [Exophiala mesophila]|uniref:SnoaL-like domain-containing protein n=1 Tax=Exophiala mesophila TaxID=212818 RepID=A0A438NA90_EXOME|nr:hypothetical protein B0A52_03741 [Exophiala mesophila]